MSWKHIIILGVIGTAIYFIMKKKNSSTTTTLTPTAEMPPDSSWNTYISTQQAQDMISRYEKEGSSITMM